MKLTERAPSLFLIGASFVLAISPVSLTRAQTSTTTSPGASATVFRAADITVTAPWTRATPNGAKVAGGYFVIQNTGAQADRLLSISTDAAARSELHEMSMVNGVMTMRPLSGLDIAPGAKVEFKPSGYHVMFINPKPLKAGDQVPAVLTFEKAGKVAVTFSVGSIGATSAPAAAGAPAHSH